jgi:hypothetical protein
LDLITITKGNTMSLRIQGPSASSHKSAAQALAKDLAVLAAPFQRPKATAAKQIDPKELPAGPLATALEQAVKQIPFQGETDGPRDPALAFAIYGEGRPQTGKPMGYCVMGFGGTEHEAWSAVHYFDNAGQTVHSAFETA